MNVGVAKEDNIRHEHVRGSANMASVVKISENTLKWCGDAGEGRRTHAC